ncbi:hypothetical protein [Bradyrhizobium sp. S3.2.12]|uniref:hypothetical protein n=1 Tax=Bradyrhizobium sp. S3.2.12 TaxID=3156387 RepID=UPI003392D3C2
MAKKDNRVGTSQVVRIYLPTDWVEGGVGADLRKEMYSQLHNRPIPRDLVETVSGFGYHFEVAWLSPPQREQVVREEDYEITPQLEPDSENGERLTMQGGPPRTTSEALAYCLSMELYAHNEMQTSPVRSGGLLPPSTVAYIAFDLLQSYTAAPPGPFLQRLIYDLLKIPTISDKELRERAAKERAAYMVAQAPSLSAKLIAELLQVDRRTIDRWKKNEEFNSRVTELREFISSPEWKLRRQKKQSFRWIEVQLN